MINNQFSHCKVCGKPETYIRFVGSEEVRGCKDMCTRKDDEPKLVIVRNNNPQTFVSEKGIT